MNKWRHAAAAAVALIGSCGGAVLSTAVPHAAAVSATAATSRYISLSPLRVMDTRSGRQGGRLAANQTVTITAVTPEVIAATGVALADVTAVVANLTSVNAGGPGYVAAWPAGAPQPSTSSLNDSYAGQTLANLITVPTDSGGKITMFTQSGGDLVVDVQGVYVRSDSASAGRLVASSPKRIVDTRTNGGAFAPDSSRRVDVTSAGVPRDASAVVLNVTVTDSGGPGYFTVWPDTLPRPLASNVNIEHPGQTIANQVIAAVHDGAVDVYSSNGGQLIVDVTGYFTGASADALPVGLFVPVAPARLADTRVGRAAAASRETDEVATMSNGGLPATGIGAVALNVTITETAAAGYVTVWPARTAQPTASALNADQVGQTVSNHVVTAVTDAGFSIFTSAGAELIADVTGYWTGATITDTEAPTPPPVSPPTTAVPQPSSPPATGPHTFLQTLFDGSPARWNPCVALDYVVNDDRATPAQRAILDAAITDVERATGIDLVHVGETSQGLDADVPAGSGAQAVIVFSDQSSSPGLLGPGDAGVGGGTTDGYSLVGGFAMFDVAEGDGANMRTTILHELGHMMGLDHVNDRNQVMYPYVNGVTQYQAGDLEGLWDLGAAQGCIRTPSGSSTRLGAPDQTSAALHTAIAN